MYQSNHLYFTSDQERSQVNLFEISEVDKDEDSEPDIPLADLFQSCNHPKKDIDSIEILLIDDDRDTSCVDDRYNSCEDESIWQLTVVDKENPRDNSKHVCMYKDCGKTFKKKNNLTKHQRRHLNQVYKCLFKGCDFQTKYLESMKKHMLRIRYQKEFNGKHSVGISNSSTTTNGHDNENSQIVNGKTQVNAVIQASINGVNQDNIRVVNGISQDVNAQDDDEIADDVLVGYPEILCRWPGCGQKISAPEFVNHLKNHETNQIEDLNLNVTFMPLDFIPANASVPTENGQDNQITEKLQNNQVIQQHNNIYKNSASELLKKFAQKIKSDQPSINSNLSLNDNQEIPNQIINQLPAINLANLNVFNSQFHLVNNIDKIILPIALLTEPNIIAGPNIIEGIECDFMGCYQRFINLHLLQEHQKLFHHFNEPKKPKIRIERNPRKQSTKKVFKCTKCDYKTNIQWNFICHGKSMHENRETLKCWDETCEKTFNSKADLLNHYLVSHESVTSVTSERSFCCHYENCLYETSFKYYLNKHLEVVHNENGKIIEMKGRIQEIVRNKQSNQQTIRMRNVKNYKKCQYQCDFPECEKKFNMDVDLRYHKLIFHHPKLNNEILKCKYDDCFYVTSSQDNFDQHEKNRHYKRCDFKDCNLIFKDTNSLVEHKKKHVKDLEEQFGQRNTIKEKTKNVSPKLLLKRKLKNRKQKPRTSFSDKQINILKSYYAKNRRPSLQKMEKIAKQVQLANRVVVVWFQNARCKENKGLEI